MWQAKDLVRPPFATYDVVVYFGCGLFALPFISRYFFEPLQIVLPHFFVGSDSGFIESLISALTLLFSVYAFGHIIAYLGSQFVEKFLDKVFGKVSTGILIFSLKRYGIRNSIARNHILRRIRKTWTNRSKLDLLFRLIVQLPALPALIFVWALGIFGPFSSRVPRIAIRALKERIHLTGIRGIRLSPITPWFKPLEYFVINRCPSAMTRMYNYLVIGGLFRSIALVFLLSLWGCVLHGLCRLSSDVTLMPPINSKTHSIWFGVEYLILLLMYLFSVLSYVKFQRRYAEEAIFSFLFANDFISNEAAAAE